MPKQKIIVSQRTLKVGDVVTKVYGPNDPVVDYEVEREVPFELPTISGCVLLIDRGQSNPVPLVLQDRRMPGSDRRWYDTHGAAISDAAVLRIADSFGNLKTIYVPAM